MASFGDALHIRTAEAFGTLPPIPLSGGKPPTMMHSRPPRCCSVPDAPPDCFCGIVKSAACMSLRRSRDTEGGSRCRCVRQISRKSRRALSQWLAEWPRNLSPTAIGDIPPWLAVAGKLLRRGSITPLAPDVEERLRPILGDTSNISPGDWIRATTEIFTLPFEPLFQHDTFDSEAERRFFETVLPNVAPPSLLRFWQRQVSVGSLTGDKTHMEANQRVDFVFAHPDRPTIVVEIDGGQHALQQDVDARRDALLHEFGIDVLRISTAELDAEDGPALRRLEEILSTIRPIVPTSLSAAARWLFAPAHPANHLLLVEAFEKGVLPRVQAVDLPIHIQMDILPELPFVSDLAAIALDDFNRLIRDVAGALGLPSTPSLRLSGVAESSLSLSFAGEIAEGRNTTLSVRDGYIPAPPEIDIPRTRPFVAQNVDRESCERLLHRVYGYDKFREGQFEAIERALKGHDTLVLLPTGSGKSIAFQLAAFLRPGVGIVVDPIISLIEDQLENLRAHGIDRAERLAGTQSVEDRKSFLPCLAAPNFGYATSLLSVSRVCPSATACAH